MNEHDVTRDFVTMTFVDSGIHEQVMSDLTPKQRNLIATIKANPERPTRRRNESQRWLRNIGLT